MLLETIEVLSDHGITCHVLLPEAGDLCNELTKLGVSFRIIPYGLWMSRGQQSRWMPMKSLVRHLATLPAVLWAIKRWNCDVVYTNTITVCTGAIASMILGRRHVWHLHEFGYEDHGLVFFFGEYVSYKIINSLSSACIVVSNALKLKYQRHILPSKLAVIYPSMHHTQLNEAALTCPRVSVPARRERFRAVVVGALTEGKRQEDAVRAVGSLVRDGASVELLIVGGGDQNYRRRVEKIVSANRLEQQVIFIGQVTDAFPFIRSSDVAIVCSESEAFGRVTIEAMLAGKPVIGARSGATPELVQAGVNGLLYEPGNSKELADKIQFLYENPTVALRLGEAAMKWASVTFTRERYGNQLLSLLTAVIESRSHRRLARVS